MVKWLKSTNKKTRRRRQEIGRCHFLLYFEAGNYYRRAKMQAVVALHFLQSWQERNKKPYQNMLRKLQSTKDLTSCSTAHRK